MNSGTLAQILALARWAPSGDNAQPWRFEIVGDARIRIHGFDTRAHCLYDFEGHASHMAHGALLETLRIAATRFGLASEWSLSADRPDSAPIYEVTLRPERDLAPDALLPCIEKRSVQRRPMRTTALTDAQRRQLTEAVGGAFSLQFFEDWRQRMAVARLLSDNGQIRLTCPEAYAVHREIIEWGARFSTDRIPEAAVGVDPLTAKLMKWALGSWKRVDFLNRYLFGTLAPRVQLDVIPALACAGHLLMRPHKRPESLLDRVHAGIAMQRLWLTATANDLQLQPQMTPVIFRWYVRSGKSISSLPAIDRHARLLAERFEKLASAETSDAFAFFCRVGQAAPPASRSTRKSLDDLMVNSASVDAR